MTIALLPPHAPRMPRATHALAAGFAIAAAVLVSSSAAHAETLLGPNTRLVVEPADGCPSEADFEAALRATLGQSSIDDAPPSRYEIAFRREERAVTGTLVVRTEGEARPFSRTVRTATCREAAEALALVIVLSIDPLVTDAPRFPDAIVTPAPAPPPSSPTRTRAPVRSPSPARRTSPVRFGATASAGVVTGIIPGVTPALDAGASASFARLPLELRGALGAVMPRDHGVAGGTIQFWSLRARLAACGVHRGLAPVSIGACAGGSVDWVFTDARSFLLVAGTNVAVPAATAGGFARYAFGPRRRFRAGLDVDAGFVLAPTTWNVIPAGSAHETSAITTRIAASFDVELF